MSEIADLVKWMVEDRKVREAQWEVEQRRQKECTDLERTQMKEQMEMLRRLMEDTRQASEARASTSRNPSEGEIKLVKLSEQDDIEAYLTTFERVMRAYEVKEERWAVKLAPQLTGKAQQAYAAMSGRRWQIRRGERSYSAPVRCMRRNVSAAI